MCRVNVRQSYPSKYNQHQTPRSQSPGPPQNPNASEHARQPMPNSEQEQFRTPSPRVRFKAVGTRSLHDNYISTFTRTDGVSSQMQTRVDHTRGDVGHSSQSRMFHFPPNKPTMGRMQQKPHLDRRTISQKLFGFSCGKITSFITLVLLILLHIEGVHDQMVCQTTLGSIKLALPQPTECNALLTIKDPPKKAKIELFKNNITRYESKGHICVKKVLIDTCLTYLFAVSHDRTTTIPDVPVTADECQTMITQKKCKFGKLVAENGILQTTNRVYAPDPGWTHCCRTYVLIKHQIVLYFQQIL